MESEFIKEAVLLIVDGTDPEEVQQILRQKIMVMNPESFEGYLCYLFMQGIIAVQAGLNPRIIEEKLLSCVPMCLKQRLSEALPKDYGEPTEEELQAAAKQWDEMEPQDTTEPFVAVFETKIRSYNDHAIQRILRESSYQSLAIILAFCKEDVRKKVSRNISDRMKAHLLEYLYTSSKRSLPYVLEKQLTILERLEDAGIIVTDPILK